MELTQSLLFSITRVKLGLYEQRIITKIVEWAQHSLRGEAPRIVKKKVNNKQPHCHIQLPVAYILSDGSTHYNHVYDAARSLMGRKFEYYDPSTKEWHGSPIIYNVTFRAKSGLLDFYADSKLVDVILDFRNGWKGYDLETALTLPTPAAVRLYILMSRQQSPLRLNIDYLKNMFGVADKYKQTADFIKKIIEPARKAIEDAHVNGFTYSRVRNGQKVVALTFFPAAAKPKEITENITSPQHNTNYIALRMLLKQDAYFTDKELAANRKTIVKFALVPGALELIDPVIHRSRRVENPKGYVVNSMRSEIRALQSPSEK